MKKNVITHIFWDFNGTILDDVQLCYEILNKMLVKYHRSTVTMETYLMVFDFPVRAYYAKVFDLSKTPFDMLAHEFMDLYEQEDLNIHLHQDVVKTIAYFKEKGFINVLLSASESNRLNRQITHYGIKHLFKDVLGTSDIYAASKLDVFKNYLKTNKINPKHVLLIGDTLHDAELAHAVKAKIILYPKGHQHPTRLKNHKTITHFSQLIDII
jgi:phosphoglycolate phosphatase